MVTNLIILELPVISVLVIILALGGVADRDESGAAVVVLLTPMWIFFAAALVTCLVRHAIYAAILGLAAMYTGFLVLLGLYWSTKAALGLVQWQDGVDPTNRETAGIISVLVVVYTLLAWLAVRYDWGLKNR